MTESYIGKRMCAVDDRLGAIGDACKWTTKDLKYCIVGSLPGISPQSVANAVSPVFHHISSVCDLRFTLTTNPTEAHIVSEFGHIDGPYGTLAWSQLPCGGIRQVKQLYDTGEDFVLASNPPQNKVGFPLVWLHEILHALGVPHLSGGLAVMNPTYNPALSVLQPLDKAELVYRYGLAPGTPPDDPIEPPTTGYTIVATPSTVNGGEQINATFTAPQGSHGLDWIGLYKVGASNQITVDWKYTGGKTSGVLSFTAPKTTGSYEFRYLLRNEFTEVKAVSQKITVISAPLPPTEPDIDVGSVSFGGNNYSVFFRKKLA